MVIDNLPQAPQRTTPAFAFSMVKRSIQECLAPRQFRKKEMLSVIEALGEQRAEIVNAFYWGK